MAVYAPRVRNFYKQIMWAGRTYPAGLGFIRTKAKGAIYKMKDETDPRKIEDAFGRGEFVIKELQALHNLHKYRTLRQKYPDELQPSDPQAKIESVIESFK